MRFLFAVPLILLLVGSVCAAELTKGQLTILETQVIPAYQTGSPDLILKSLQPLARKANSDQIAAADAKLAAQGIPSIAQMLSDARLSLIEQATLANIPAPRGKELLLTLAGLKARLEGLLALRTTERSFADAAPPATSFKEFEQRFWEMHVLENQFSAGQRMAQYGSSWKNLATRLAKQNVSDADQQLLKTDFEVLSAALTDLRRELAERLLELRIKRLEFTVDRLTKPTLLPERFQAAFALDMDGEVLEQFFFAEPDKGEVARRDDISFRPALADEALPARIQDLISSGKTAAGEDLIRKSRLLFTGLHWWYRGRYGVGSDGNGLLKSVDALKSPEAMFGLYMPLKTPNPTASSQQGAQGSQYQRRHYQLWQFETRSIQKSLNFASAGPVQQSASSVSTITHLSRFY